MERLTQPDVRYSPDYIMSYFNSLRISECMSKLQRLEDAETYSDEVCSRAIEAFGTKAQCIVAIEELSELQKEVCKALRGTADYDHIAEEIADALIVIEQLILLYNCKHEVARWRRKKLIRLEGMV